MPMNNKKPKKIMDCEHPDWLRDVDPLGTKYCMYCNEDLE